MAYAVLADLVLLVHLAFVVFVVAGGLLVARFKKLLVPHLAAAAWGVFIAASGGVCPLTPLENELLRRAGRHGYAGSFLEQYLAPLVYPEGLTRGVQWALAAIVIVVNVCVYGFYVRGRRPIGSAA